MSVASRPPFKAGSLIQKEHPRYPARDNETDSKNSIKRIRMGMSIATSRANGEILDNMREIAQSQLAQLKEVARQRLLTASEAAALHRIAQVFNTVDSGTRREQESVDYSQMSDEDLEAAAMHAENLLKAR